MARERIRRARLPRRQPLSKPSGTQTSSDGFAISLSPSIGKRLKDLEYLGDLYGGRQYTVYDRMRRSDAHIYGLATALDLPLVEALWRVDPAEDTDTEAAKNLADFVRVALFERQMDRWPAQVRQFLLYPYFGFAPFEICWTIRDGAALIDRMAWIPPATIPTDGIVVERGRVSRVEQYQSVNGVQKRVPIPGEKLVWFVHEKEGSNWRGTSLLRPMYRDWYSKEKAIVMFLILAERMGGILHISTPKNATATDKAAADELGTNFRIGDSMYLRLPEGWEADLKGVPMELGELRSFIKDCDMAISDAVLLEVLDLPKSDTGSRALGATLTEMYLNAIQARAKYLAHVFNEEEGVIDQLVAYNFGESARDIRPQLVAGRVSRMNLAPTADALLKLGQAGYPMGPEMWKFVAEEAEFPAPDEKLLQLQFERALNPPEPVAEPNGDPAADKNAAAARPNGETRAKRTDDPQKMSEGSHWLKLADGGFLRPLWRDPSGVECYVALDEVLALYNGAKDELLRRTAAARDAQVTKLVQRVEIALDGSDPTAALSMLAKQSAPGEERIASVIRSVFVEWVQTGREQVADELRRQARGAPVVATITEQRAGAPLPTLAMADVPEEFIAGAARAQAASISQQATTAAVGAGLRATTSTPARANLSSVTRAASDRATVAASREVSHMVDAGRMEFATSNATLIGLATYSAILDERVCTECASMDGQTTGDLDLAEDWVPNPSCEGEAAGHPCRCMVIFSYGEAGGGGALPDVAEGPPAPTQAPMPYTPGAPPAGGNRVDYEVWFSGEGVDAQLATHDVFGHLVEMPDEAAEELAKFLHMLNERGIRYPNSIRAYYDALPNAGSAGVMPGTQALRINVAVWPGDGWSPTTAAHVVKMCEGRGHYAFSAPMSEIAHEMGHLEHLRSVGLGTFADLAGPYTRSALDWAPSPHASLATVIGDGERFARAELIELGNELNRFDTLAPYANAHIEVSAYGLSNPCEFVAETYMRLFYGESVDERVLFWYDHFGGPRPPQP